MKTIFALFLSTVGAIAQADYSTLLLLAPAASSPTYLIKQDFEGTGYDNSETWTEIGGNYYDSDNPLYTATGSHSMMIVGAGSSLQSPTFADSAVSSYFFSYATSLVSSQHEFFSTFNAGSQQVACFVRSTGRIAIYDQVIGFGPSPSDAIPNDSLIYIWIDLNHITGDSTLCWSTDQTKPTSGSKFATAASSLTTGLVVNRVWLETGPASQTNWWDKVRADDVAIGSSPQ